MRCSSCSVTGQALGPSGHVVVFRRASTFHGGEAPHSWLQNKRTQPEASRHVGFNARWPSARRGEPGAPTRHVPGVARACLAAVALAAAAYISGAGKPPAFAARDGPGPRLSTCQVQRARFTPCLSFWFARILFFRLGGAIWVKMGMSQHYPLVHWPGSNF